MAYTPTETRLGLKSFTNVDTTTALPLGTIVRGADSVSGMGGGEFIYLKGIAAVTAGQMVTYNANLGTVTRLAASQRYLGAPVAVAMAAITAATLGWFQVVGIAKTLKSAKQFTAAARIFISPTTGRVSTSAACGKQILNAWVQQNTVTTTTSTVLIMLSRAFIQGQII